MTAHDNKITMQEFIDNMHKAIEELETYSVKRYGYKTSGKRARKLLTQIRKDIPAIKKITIAGE